MRHFIFVSLLCFGVSISEGRLRSAAVPLGPNPGLVVRLYKTAIDPIIEHGTGLFANYASKLPMPDLKATVSGIEFETSNARIASCEKPRVQYELIAPDQLDGSLELPAIGLQTDFKAIRHVAIGSGEKDQGLVVFNATDVKATFTLKLGENEKGVPNVANFDCKATLGQSSLKVQRAEHQFAVEALTVAAQGIRPVFETQVCSLAKSMITEEVNRFLARIPNIIEINNKLAIKYKVKPVINQKYVEAQVSGKVITDAASPYNPEPFVEVPNENAMVAVFLSDAVVNDVLHQLYENKLTELTINKHSPPILYSLVSFDCAADQMACLGNQIPSLVEKYGKDADVEFTFKNMQAPVVEFSQDKATFKAVVSTSLDVQRRGSEAPEHEATATVNIAGDLKVKIDNDRIYGKVTLDKPVVNIDQEDAKKYEEKISDTIKQIVENHLNGDLLLKGLPLRLPFGIRLTDPLVQFAPHTLQAHTGFEYKPGNGSGENDQQGGNVEQGQQGDQAGGDQSDDNDQAGQENQGEEEETSQ